MTAPTVGGGGAQCLFCPSFTGFVVMLPCAGPCRLKLAHILLVFTEVVCSVWSWHGMINDLCGCRYLSCLCQGVKPSLPPHPSTAQPTAATSCFFLSFSFFFLLFVSVNLSTSSSFSLFFLYWWAALRGVLTVLQGSLETSDFLWHVHHNHAHSGDPTALCLLTSLFLREPWRSTRAPLVPQ